MQEKDLEVCQASLAVAHAAAELATSDPSELSSVPASLTSQQLDELEQLRRTVTTLHEELDVLRSMNTELQNEIESVVSEVYILHVCGYSLVTVSLEVVTMITLMFLAETFKSKLWC